MWSAAGYQQAVRLFFDLDTHTLHTFLHGCDPVRFFQPGANDPGKFANALRYGSKCGQRRQKIDAIGEVRSEGMQFGLAHGDSAVPGFHMSPHAVE